MESAGFARTRALIATNRRSADLYLCLGERLGPHMAHITEKASLCQQLGVTATTLWRCCAYLENIGLLAKIRLPGRLTAYALHPSEVGPRFTTLSYDDDQDQVISPLSTQKAADLMRDIALTFARNRGEIDMTEAHLLATDHAADPRIRAADDRDDDDGDPEKLSA